MIVTVVDELWAWRSPEGALMLGMPSARRQRGGTAPGLVDPVPIVFAPGVKLQVLIADWSYDEAGPAVRADGSPDDEWKT